MLSALLALLSIGFFALAFHAPGVWKDICVNLGSTAIGFCIALAVIDRYTSRKERRRAVLGVLQLISVSMSEFHNRLVKQKVGCFSNDEWTTLNLRYVEAGGKPEALRPAERDALYRMVDTSRAEFQQAVDRLEADLRELAAVIGWSFDPRLLSVILQCRHSINQYRSAVFDGTDATKLKVCEIVLDIDNSIFSVMHILTSTAGLKSHQWLGDSPNT